MKSLLTLTFFVLMAVANAYADSSPMEKEISRELNQIQQIGELNWSNRITLEKEKQEEKKTKIEIAPGRDKIVLN